MVLQKLPKGTLGGSKHTICVSIFDQETKVEERLGVPELLYLVLTDRQLVKTASCLITMLFQRAQNVLKL